MHGLEGQHGHGLFLPCLLYAVPDMNENPDLVCSTFSDYINVCMASLEEPTTPPRLHIPSSIYQYEKSDDSTLYFPHVLNLDILESPGVKA